MSREKLKVLVVAPGAIHSTFDMFQYYLGAFRRSPDIKAAMAYNYHNMILFYDVAFRALAQETGRDPESLYESSTIAYRATSQLLMDIWRKKPDVVFVVCGTGMSPYVFSWIGEFRKDTNRNFLMALYLTESPYMDEEQKEFMKYFDVVFVNDKNSAEKYNPDGSKFIYYLPHSYDIVSHGPGYAADEYHHDVFFCGTGFAERAKLLAGVDWSGIDFKLYGHWDMAEPEDQAKLEPYLTKGLLENQEVADFYRGSKIGLNIHRTSGPIYFNEVLRHISKEEAYSIGPRTVEAAACGIFQLSDYRPELLEVFGDTIPVYENSEQLEHQIRYYLEHEDVRHNMAKEAMRRTRGMSYDDRVRWMNDIFYEALTLVPVQKLRENHDG